VQGRQNLIRQQHKDELQKYMTGIITHKEQKLIAINNMPDHFHLLIGLKPSIALSDLVGDIKASSSGFINDSHWVRGRFCWQEGFGAFSYSHSQLTSVIRYIQTKRSTTHEEAFKRNTWNSSRNSMYPTMSVTFSDRSKTNNLFRLLDATPKGARI
jgi:putative transposase